MADKKISVLPDRPTVDGTEQIPVAYSGTTYKITVNKIKDFIVGLFANKATVLDNLGVSAENKLQFNGTDVQASATQASGASTEVQFRNATTGALDSDSVFKYDKATGVLISGKSFKDIPALTSVMIGFEAGKINAGNNNLFVGYQSGLKNTTGNQNLFAGYASGYNNTTGVRNTFIGSLAGNGNTTGSRNTYTGEESGYQNNGDDNVFIGRGSGLAETNASSRLVIESNEARNIAKDYLVDGSFSERWIKLRGAQLIRAFEITSIAPVVTGTVTAGTVNTLTDSSKTYVLNQYANFVVEKTTAGGEKEQRVILSNTVAGELTVRDNWTVTPVAGDTFKIITATIITAYNLGSIYRFNLSSGYDHALILPSVTDTFNRAFCEFYIEGHSGTAALHKFPASGQLIQGQPKTEMVANRELVRLISHAQSTYHWDVEASVGLDAYGEATWSPQIVIANQTVPLPLDGNLTINLIRRFAPVNIGGSLWAKYTSSLIRKFRFNIVCDVTLNGSASSVITIAIRYFNAAAGTTTDIIVPGSSIPMVGTGSRNVFVLSKLLELSPGDRFQIVHYNNTNTNYTLIPQLTVD